MPNRYSGVKSSTSDRDFSRNGPVYPKNKKLALDYWQAQVSTGDLSYLHDIPSKLKRRNNEIIIANLGCFRGHSATALALGMKDASINGKIYTVDLYSKMHSARIGKKGVVGNRAKAEDRFRKHSVESYIEVCQGSTVEFSQKLSNLQFDFVFIDADHSYESCREDFDCWNGLVVKEGLIALHDCHLNSVNQVVEEIQDKWVLVDHYQSIKTFKRK